MKQKVGILTTYFASNFGAMLQPFALKRHLEQLGYDVEMIRYKQKNIEHFYNPWKWDAFKSGNIKRILGYLYNLPCNVKKYYTFQRFMLKYINPNKGFSKEIPNDKDFYFIGSDQIWSPKNTHGFDDIYWGYFKVKNGAIKASYAASAEQIDYNSQNIAYLKKALMNFDYLSVRELQLEQDLKKKTGRQDICTVLDPTMLVDPKIYDEFEHIHPCPGEDYIFLYDIRNCKMFLDKILDHAKFLKARLVIVSEMPDRWYMKYAKKHKEVIYSPYAGVEYFIGCMKYAKFVYTASFHGSIFAILNHKKFYTLNLRDGKMTRPTHLLHMVGIPNRLLAIEDQITDEEIDYEKVDILLNEQRMLSRSFVLDVLNKK